MKVSLFIVEVAIMIEFRMHIAVLQSATLGYLLPYQDDLADDRSGPDEIQNIIIAEEMLSKAKAARDLANTALGALAVQDSEAMLNLLSKKASQYSSLDHTWDIEQAFFQGMAGDLGNHRLEQRVEQMLPQEGLTKEITMVLQQLHGLQASALYRFCSVTAQGSVNTVTEMLASMTQGRPPRMASNPSAFIVSVKSRLPLFCTCKGPKDKVLIGKPALLHMIHIIQNTPAADRTLEMFENPQIFAWLLSKGEKAKVNDMMSEVMASSMQSGKGSSRKLQDPASASGSSSSDKKGASAESQALKDAMVMFG